MSLMLVQFVVDESYVRKSFLARMTVGLLRPGDIGTAGSFRELEPLFVPVRCVTMTVVSNWTGESGSNGPGGRPIWTPLSGQHRWTYRDMPLFVAHGHDGYLFRQAVRHLGRALPATDVVGAIESVEATETVDDTVARALGQAEDLEAVACTQMLPGPGRRNLRVNTTIESSEVRVILLPFWRVSFAYAGRTVVGWVDGVTGSVYAQPPVSAQRVAAVVAGGMGFLMAAMLAMFVFSLVVSGLAVAEAARVAEEQRVEAAATQEAARILREAQVQKLNDDAPAAAESIGNRLADADAAIASGDIGAAKPALDDVSMQLAPYRTLEPLPAPIAPFLGQVEPRVTHVHALELQVGATTAIDGEDFLAASKSLSEALIVLESLPEDYPKASEAKKLVGRLTSQRRSISGRVKKQEKERAEAEALRALCGEAPAVSAWDGGLYAAERSVKESAHDPSSIAVENCTTPVLTKQCWRSTCVVRGKNAFGGMIRNDYTFYLAQNLVIAMDEG